MSSLGLACAVCQVEILLSDDAELRMDEIRSFVAAHDHDTRDTDLAGHLVVDLREDEERYTRREQ